MQFAISPFLKGMRQISVLMVHTLFLIYCGIDNYNAKGPHPPMVTRHYHPKPSRHVKLTTDTKVLHDIKHLEEDMEKQSYNMDFEKMDDEELEFNYFKIHDTDNNNQLDGLEIYHAILHGMKPKDWNMDQQEITQEMEDEISEMVDRVLEADDFNKDGYLSYVEYISGRKSERQKQNQHQADL